jgi:putative nucleotidyltransferase with HDIG domain
MSSVANIEKYAKNSLNLIPISFSTLIPGSKLGLDIYILGSDGAEPILYSSRDEPLDSGKLRDIVRRGKIVPYVDASSHQVYQAYLRSHWDRIVSDENLPMQSRVTVLSEVSRDVLRQAFRDGCTEKIVQQSQFLSKGISQVMGNDSAVYQELKSILHHDYATFTHSVNVALYTTMLAKKLGYSESDLNHIAAGGLLHDIGKLSIDDRILTKPGKLDDLEFRTVQRHPTIGFAQVAQRNDLNLGQLMMIYQHHEKLDGSGYPVGSVDDEIHPWAKICTVVDIFEAITSVRPYRTPMVQATALEILNKSAPTKLDCDMVKAWSEIVLERGGKK